MLQFAAELDKIKTFFDRIYAHGVYSEVELGLKTYNVVYKSLEVKTYTSDRVAATTIACPIVFHKGNNVPIRVDAEEMNSMFSYLQSTHSGQRVTFTISDEKPEQLDIECGKFKSNYRLLLPDQLPRIHKMPDHNSYLQACAVIDADALLALVNIAMWKDYVIEARYSKDLRQFELGCGADVSWKHPEHATGFMSTFLTPEAVRGTKELPAAKDDACRVYRSRFSADKMYGILQNIGKDGQVVSFSMGDDCPCSIEYAWNGCIVKTHLAPRSLIKEDEKEETSDDY